MEEEGLWGEEKREPLLEIVEKCDGENRGWLAMESLVAKAIIVRPASVTLRVANNCFANGDLNVGSNDGGISDSTATGGMATESNASDAMKMLI